MNITPNFVFELTALNEYPSRQPLNVNCDFVPGARAAIESQERNPTAAGPGMLRLLVILLTSFATAPSLLCTTPHAITPGNILISHHGGSPTPEGILELKPGTLAFVQFIPLPSGYTFEDGFISTVLVRPSDHAIFTNVLDAVGEPTLLMLSSSGGFIAAVHPGHGITEIDQLVFDPADSTKATVLAGVNFTYPGVEGMKPSTASVFTKISLTGAIFTGMTLDSCGNIYVGDSATGIIGKYSSSGTFIKDFAMVSGSDKAIDGMTFDDHGNLYVAQFPTHEVIKFSSSGFLLGTFMAPHIVLPLGVFFNPADHFLYVGDAASGWMTILKTDGTFVADKYLGGTHGEATVVPGLLGLVGMPGPVSASSTYSSSMLSCH